MIVDDYVWRIRDTCIPEVSASKLICQVNKTTFRHFPQKLWIFINCHILSYTWVQQKEWAAVKRRIYFTLTVPRIVKIFWETYRLNSPSLAFKLFGPHVSRQTKCPNFHRNASFFLLNLVCWNKDQRLNQFGRPKFEFDSAHVKYRF